MEVLLSSLQTEKTKLESQLINFLWFFLKYLLTDHKSGKSIIFISLRLLIFNKFHWYSAKLGPVKTFSDGLPTTNPTLV